MELGSIERELRIDAAPATVYEVVSRAEHLRQWWPDDVELEPTPGARGHLVFGRRGSPDAHVPQVAVVEADPPRRFSFRWGHPEGEDAHEGNSLLVTFDLAPDGEGTRLRMTETGFRHQGWEVAVLEQRYQEHVDGWAHFLPRLVAYAPTVEVAA